MAKRLKCVMSKLVDEAQCACMGGLCMLDGVLLANEIVNEAKRKKKECLIFKVNFEKAYDFVSWEFLFYMLRRMRFCEK